MVSLVPSGGISAPEWETVGTVGSQAKRKYTERNSNNLG